MEFSIQILPPPPFRWKKNIFFPQFFFMSLLCLSSPNLARTLKQKLISAPFKMFGTKKRKYKILTNTANKFTLTPQQIKNKEKY